MKKKSRTIFYQLVALGVIVFTISSCSDIFDDQKAGERITPDEHYKSMIDAEVSIMGAFSPLQDALPKLIMLDGLRSDQMVTGPGADAYLADLNLQAFTLDNPFIDASYYYKVIINCNEVLANIDKIHELDRNFDEFTLNSYKGGLYSLRSWSYLTLLKLYGEAAYIDDNLATLPTDKQQNFMPKAVLIDTLINQLIPYVFDPSVGKEFVEYRLFPLMNTKAVLGELYLEKSDYTNAATYLKMACESYQNQPTLYKVDKSYTKEAWKNIFIGAENGQTENLSVVSYNLNESQINPLPKWMSSSDMYMVKPAAALVDSFLTQKQQTGSAIGDQFRGTGALGGITFDTTATGDYYIKKYMLDKGQEFSTDIIISRAADLHLLLAEALNRSGDEKTALILLNAGFNGEKVKPAPYAKWSGNLGVRGRAFLASKIVPDSINVISNGDTTRVANVGNTRIEYVEDLIMNERALELAFEGKRWFDLVRIAERRGTPEYLADKVASKFEDPAQADAVRTKLMNPANWYLPLKK